MSVFIDTCIRKIKEKKSPLIVGLDPHFELLPEYLQQKSNSLSQIGKTLFEFNRKIIDATHDLVPLVKPQIAFYERYGYEGIKAYQKTIDYAHEKGLLVIGDVKRNDIGSTAKAYSDAHLGKVKINGQEHFVFNADAITVNGYLGTDGIIPFVEDAAKYEKGIFVLVKTSNKSSVELQDLTVIKDSKQSKIYEVMGSLVNEWGKKVMGVNNYSSIGAVVGATFPTELKQLRKIMPASFFLVPGIGAQGGTVKDVLDAFDSEGLGAVINVSRSVIFAFHDRQNFKSKNFDIAARDEVLKLNNEFHAGLNTTIK